MTTRQAEPGKVARRVSIILPLYNSASRLSELDRQLYFDREIILVDDGSLDDTWEKATA